MLVELAPEIAVLRFGLFALDLRRRELRREGHPVRLAKLPFEALRLLAAHPQIVLTRAELMAALWPGQLADRSENLDTLLRQVRAALGDAAQNPRFLQTVRGVGFCFLAEVTRVVEEPPAALPAYLPEPTPPAAAPAQPRAPRRGRFGWAGAAAALALLSAVGWLAAAPGAPPLSIHGAWTQITHDGLPKGGGIFVRGGWVYFTEARDGRYRVVRVPASGGAAEAVAGAGPDPLLLGVSQSGDRLLFESPVADAPMRSDAPLWLLQNGGAHRLDSLAAHAAAFRPDGSSILLARGDALYEADAGGIHSRLLQRLPAEPTALAWAPDGARFRFMEFSNPDGAPAEWEARADGSHLRSLGPVLTAADGAAAAWRPDGSGSLLLAARDNATPQTWEFPTRPGWGRASGSPRRLDLGPISRSPQIAFDGGMQRLFRMGTAFSGTLLRYDAGSRQLLPLAPDRSLEYLDYSPSGDAIAYDTTSDGALWRSGPDFSHPQALTPSGLRTEAPRWSRDGRWIAFMAETPGQPWALDMVPAAGGAPQVLVRGTARAGIGAPTWSPDGSTLYFGHVNCADPAT